MTERSMFWADGIGDGGPYSQDQLRLLYDALAGSEDANRGVLVAQGNQLAPSSTGNNNIRMATGRGVVDGTLYENDAILDIVTTSPAIGTTGRRLVLRKFWSARTVRAIIISSADGNPAIPILTQFSGTAWDIPIASFTITTGGVIGALTDQRQFCEGTDSRGITILDRDLATVVAPADGTEQTLYTFTIPANVLGTTGGVRLTLGGEYFHNFGGDERITWRGKLGATTALDSTTGAGGYNSSANTRKWSLTIWFLNDAAADAQKWSAHGIMSGAAPESMPFDPESVSLGEMAVAGGYDTSAEDTSGALVLEVTIQHAAVKAGNFLTKELAMLELLPAA